MSETKPKKVLIISHDKIGSTMAGPGIRYHYLAETLSDKFDVTVGFFDKSYLPDDGLKRRYQVKHVDAGSFEKDFQDCDIIIAHWLNESMIAYCDQNRIFMVFDLYVVGPVENLAGALFNDKKSTPQSDGEFDRSLHMYRRFFENGDLFLLSNPRQLDFWTGYIFGADQVHISTYAKRPIYDRLIFAPMGIDTKAPVKHTKNVIRGVMPGIDKKDKVLIWTGGIWGHFDGQVLIRAMKKLQKTHPDIKLVFFGTKHPNPNITESPESIATQELANKLGLLNKTVFFNSGWVGYHDRINYLLEADVAVNTHKQSIETEFSQRTRVLDHLLTGLPTISTGGDYLSDVVIKENDLGLSVPAGDDEELAKAIAKILEPATYKKIRKNIESYRENYDWSETVRPLKEFLLNDPYKLQRIAPKLKYSSRAIRLAKRATPLPVKKVIVRGRRLIK